MGLELGSHMFIRIHVLALISFLPECPWLKECPSMFDMPGMRLFCLPMICRLRLFWIPPKADGKTAGLTAQQRMAGHAAHAEQTSDWQSFMHASEQVIQVHFAT